MTDAQPTANERVHDCGVRLSRMRKGRHPLMTDRQYLERWKSKCAITESGCWQWPDRGMGLKGAIYPEASYRNNRGRLNRLVLMITQRPLADGEMALHQCDNHLCINPGHLYIGTHKQNMFDMNSRGRNGYKRKTHCKYGHEFTPENTEIRQSRGIPGKGRACKMCARIRQRMESGWPEDEARRTPLIPPHASTSRRRPPQ